MLAMIPRTRFRPSSISFTFTPRTGDARPRELQRDVHLKSADFLDVEKLPTLSFKSTDSIKVAGDGELKVRGDLTIRGVTRNVTFAVEGANATGEGSLGQSPNCHLGNH